MGGLPWLSTGFSLHFHCRGQRFDPWSEKFRLLQVVAKQKAVRLPWCPVVRTACLHWVRTGFDPRSGSYDPASHAAKKKEWVISLRDETPVS